MKKRAPHATMKRLQPVWTWSAMLALPTLDVDILKKTGHDIGAWPKGATGDFDGRLPPPMKLLLAGDPAAKKAIEKIGAGFEFSRRRFDERRANGRSR